MPGRFVTSVRVQRTAEPAPEPELQDVVVIEPHHAETQSDVAATRVARPTSRLADRPAWLDDPAAPSLLLFGGLVLVGFVAIVIGWKVAARTLVVAYQTPALVSGGMGGLALILLGSGLAAIQTGRRLAAGERAETEALLDEAAALVETVKAKGGRV